MFLSALGAVLRLQRATLARREDKLIGMNAPSLIEIEARSGVSRAQMPNSFMIALYRALAPYRGCAHACTYCDGRAEKYFVEGDFARDIAVRRSLPERIAQDVTDGAPLREFGAIAIGSGVTDIYQPVEAELGLTRRMLEALLPVGNPISLQTKSALILRDFDLLARFPKVLVAVTITTLDATAAAYLEPGASPPAERLEVIRRAREAGFHAGILAMPLCPGIGDGDAEITALLGEAKRAGAEFVWPGGLTLRPGRQKETYMAMLAEHWPALGEHYVQAFSENRPSGMPLAAHSRAFEQRIARLMVASGLPALPPESVHRNLLCRSDSLFVLFSHMQTLYRRRGVDTRALQSATDAYGQWLKETRSGLRRKRIAVLPGEPFPLTRILDERLAELCAGDGFAQVCGNEKLARLARAIVIDGRHFDYVRLQLV